MSENNMKPVSFIDSTLQLRWKISKEAFDNCEEIYSPKFKVQIGSEESKWIIKMRPKGTIESGRDQVVITLGCLESNKKYSVLFEFQLETANGYWPNNFLENLFSKRSVLHTDNFLEFEFGADTENGFTFSSTEEFRQQFLDDNVTLVATLVIDMAKKSDRYNMNLADEFTKDMRSLSVLDDMCMTSLSSVMVNISHVTKPSWHHDLNFSKECLDTRRIKKFWKLMIPPQKLSKRFWNGFLPKDIDAKAKELIHLADMYGLKGLTDSCIVSLVKTLSPENATEILTIVDEHAPNSKQRSKILDFIKKEAAKVIKTQHWRTFVQNYPDLITDIVATLAVPPSEK